MEETVRLNRSGVREKIAVKRGGVFAGQMAGERAVCPVFVRMEWINVEKRSFILENKNIFL